MNSFLRKHFPILILCVMMLLTCACHTNQKNSDQENIIHATVVEIEKFGHAVLDITSADLHAAGYALGDMVHVSLASFESDMPFFDGYYSNPGSYLLRGLSSVSPIAICINYGDFSQKAGVNIGDTVAITMVEPGGMLSLQKLCSLQYSNHRTEYSSDTVFANFRPVTTGLIGNNKLYRSASPIDNIHGRASYANDLIADAGVATVLNLADSYDELQNLCDASDFDSTYYRNLYEAGNVMALDLTGNFYSQDFAATIVEGFTFLAQNPTPYCIHCTEGKDRAGFTAMLLEALMGASLQEIIDDYMLSFYNYYGVDKDMDPERYQTILDNNLMAMLFHVTGATSADQLSQMDLEQAVTQYLLRAGMAESHILTLKDKLR